MAYDYNHVQIEGSVIIINGRQIDPAGQPTHSYVSIETHEVDALIKALTTAKRTITDKNRASLEKKLTTLKDERKALEVKINTLSKELSL